MKVSFGCSKPTFWSFVEKLRRLQSQADLIIVQHSVGTSNAPRRKRKQVWRQAVILGKVKDYNKDMRSEYLKSMGYLFATLK